MGASKKQENVQICTGSTIKQQCAAAGELRRRAEKAPEQNKDALGTLERTPLPPPSEQGGGPPSEQGGGRVSLGGPISENAPIYTKTHRKPPGAYEYGGSAANVLNIQLILFAEFMTEVTYRIGGSKSIFVIFGRPKSGPT